MGKDLMERLLSLDHTASHYLGMSLFRTRLQSHTCTTQQSRACAAADTAAGNEVTKYAHLATTHNVCSNISGNWRIIERIQAVESVQNLGN